jgi:hypothetical protein
LENKVAIIDTKKLVSGTSSEIIAAIVKDKQSIDKENADFVAAQKDKIAKGEKTGISRGTADSSLNTNDQAELDKVTQNLDNLIGNVVKTAIEDNKVNKDEINKIIEDTNKNIADPSKKLDLEKVVPLDKTAGVDAALQKAKDEELKKLEATKIVIEEAKKKEADAEKAKLAEVLKSLEAEKARIEKAKADLGLNKPTPTPIATTAPTPSASPAVIIPNTNHSTPSPSPIVAAHLSLVGDVPISSPIPDQTLLYLNLDIGNVTVSDQVYGVEVHVVYNNNINFKIATPTPTPTSTTPPTSTPIPTSTPTPIPTPVSDFFNSTDSVIRYGPIYYGSSQNEIIYAAVLPAVGNVAGKKTLVQLPLGFWNTYTSTNQILVYYNIVRKDGTVLIKKMTFNDALTLDFFPLHTPL